MKKYIISVVIFIIIICFLFLVFKKNDSNLDYTISLKYSELNDYLDENSNALIYITNKNDKNNIDNKNNIDLVYMYLDKKEESDFINKYGVKIPILAYFNDGILIEYTEYNDNIEEFLKRNGFLE